MTAKTNFNAAIENCQKAVKSENPSFWATRAFSCLYREAMAYKADGEIVPNPIWNAIARLESGLAYSTGEDGKATVIDHCYLTEAVLLNMVAKAA